jgi:hypothetical protein
MEISSELLVVPEARDAALFIADEIALFPLDAAR